jgi:hypothetical protein
MQVVALDLYGGEDYPALGRGAPALQAVLHSTGQSQSQQRLMPQPNHYCADQGDARVKAVAGRLDFLQ